MGDCRESGWWLKKPLNAAFKITTNRPVTAVNYCRQNFSSTSLVTFRERKPSVISQSFRFRIDLYGRLLIIWLVIQRLTS
jgi:hypothetical protein